MNDQLSFFAPPQLSDRLFLAAFPDPFTAARITRLGQALCAEHGLTSKLIATDRMHSTLFHFGDFAGGLPNGLVEQALALPALAMAPFAVTFDRVMSFSGRPGNRPLVLRGGEGLSDLEQYQKALCMTIGKAGLAGKEKSAFTPHVTLLYAPQSIAEQAIEPISWQVREIVLVHSLLGQGKHIPLARWPLSP